MLIDDRRICMRWQTTNEMGRFEISDEPWKSEANAIIRLK